MEKQKAASESCKQGLMAETVLPLGDLVQTHDMLVLIDGGGRAFIKGGCISSLGCTV